MKSSTQIFVSLVTALATFGQSLIISASSQELSKDLVSSRQVLHDRYSLPGKSSPKVNSLITQKSGICKEGRIPVTIDTPNSPALSGNLKKNAEGKDIDRNTRCVFFKNVTPISSSEIGVGARLRIKPKKTWLIIHGWQNNSESAEIKALALEVAKQKPEDRVLMLDWGEAAINDGNSNPGVPLTDWRLSNANLGVYYAAAWIRPIAEAVVDKLQNEYGLTKKEANQNLNVIGHSLGTLMASEIGAVYAGLDSHGQRETGGLPINSIIALDPASELSTNGSLFINLGGYDVDGRTPAYIFKSKFIGAHLKVVGGVNLPSRNMGK
jgi:pimeloyl-ACP methyl ester carboxylesterase